MGDFTVASHFKPTLATFSRKKTAALAAFMFANLIGVNGYADEIPDFIGMKETSILQFDQIQTGLNFVAALDDPPFSFLDSSSKMSGLSVFLARAICEELNYSSNCVISGRISSALSEEISAESRSILISHGGSQTLPYEKYRFSRPILRIPGRFVSRLEPPMQADFNEGLAGTKIGTIANTAEERMVRAYFPDASTTGFANRTLLLKDLTAGKIDLAFASGIQIADWLSSSESQGCCRFAGGAYYSAHFFGEGVRFAVPATDSYLVPQIDAALMSLQRKGKIEELFLRFFSINFFKDGEGSAYPAAID
jgi:polar amino acid transport system substrate-binding protein